MGGRRTPRPKDALWRDAAIQSPAHSRLSLRLAMTIDHSR